MKRRHVRKSYDWARWLIVHQWIPLLAILCLCGTLWIFAEVADEVIEGESRAFDEAILLFFRTEGQLDDPIGPGWVEEMARDITAMGSMGVQILVTAAMIGALLIVRKNGAALFVLAAVGIGVAMSTVLKQGFQRPRPDIVPHVAETYTMSFPSGHSLTAAVTYLVLGVLMGWAAKGRLIKIYYVVVALIFVVLIGISRIYLGVHYPTDVVAGWTAGTGWALLCWLFAEWLRRRRILVEQDLGQIENEPEAA